MYNIIFLKLYKVYSFKRQIQANLHVRQPPISNHLSKTPKYSQSSLIRTSFKWPPYVSDSNHVSWLMDLLSKVTPSGLILVKWAHLVSVHQVFAFWVVAYKRFDGKHRRKFPSSIYFEEQRVVLSKVHSDFWFVNLIAL